MVVFLDLDDSEPSDSADQHRSYAHLVTKPWYAGSSGRAWEQKDEKVTEQEQVDLGQEQQNGLVNDIRERRVGNGFASEEEKAHAAPAVGGGFSAALACYPVVIQLAHSLDLNTLHALSRVCHQFRTNLLQSRKQLVAQSLRCVNDPVIDDDDEEEEEEEEEKTQEDEQQDTITWNHTPERRMTSTKIGPCARDMVSECRRCADVVCRNCTTKPRSALSLPHRLRRLCSPCLTAPLATHTSSLSTLFTSPAFSRSPCSCAEVAWLCQPCAHAVAADDISYRRIWQWRTRYSTYLGGLGTGIAEGNEGVHCGRDRRCLKARDVEVEVACGAAEGEGGEAGRSEGVGERMVWVPVVAVDGLESHGGAGEGAGGEGLAEDARSGYRRQEMYGVGGGMQQKFKKMLRVGRPVEEYENEREKGDFIAIEARGARRSWCGWCDRVVPAKGEC